MESAQEATTPFLSVDELAARYSVSPATVHAWIYKRTGPRSHKIGRHRRFRLDDVLAWEEMNADDYADDCEEGVPAGGLARQRSRSGGPAATGSLA